MTNLPPIRRRWPGATVVVVASGPSLVRDDCETLRAARADGRCKVVAVNDAFRLCPWADAIYACDAAWWNHHASALADRLADCWTCDAPAAARHGLNHAAGFGDFAKAADIAKPTEDPRWLGLSTDARYIGYGANSGFQAVNLAAHFGAARIVLLGFDMAPAPDGRTHFFGDHPAPLQRNSPYGQFVAAFAAAAPVLRSWGIDVLNSSRASALDCFPCVGLRLELG